MTLDRLIKESGAGLLQLPHAKGDISSVAVWPYPIPSHVHRTPIALRDHCRYDKHHTFFYRRRDIFACLATQQDGSRRTRQRGATQEADEDVVFAAEMLGLVYDRVRDVGDLLRVIGDTTGGLAGGSIKLLSASVNVREWTSSRTGIIAVPN